MGERLQAVKGMNDILPPSSAKWAHVERRAREVFEAHGYREIRPPVVEYTPLFVRSIGEATDVVEKEMYTFPDRDQRSLTLRPEATAGIVRAYLEHSLHMKEPVTRWWCAGPMFRHERAQKGRYRQFYQMDVEAFGVAEPTIDAEQIALLHELFAGLGIPGVDVVVNSVGGPEDRPRYREALRAYFEPRAAELCEDCRRRLGTNPLRILDCKVAGCQALVAGAPSVLDHLGEAAKVHFAGVRAALDALEVPYRVDPRLVRGLDYYTGTTFELRATGGELGTQNALGGGGRYDQLVAEMGGPATPAIGFAFGMERVVMTLPGDEAAFDVAPDVFLAAQGEAARLLCLRLSRALRAAGLRVDLEHRATSMKAQLKRADRARARAVAIVGEAELAAGTVQLKDLTSGEQTPVPQADLPAAVRRLAGP
jgi:histidyl-tRNA synthetase